MEVLSSILTTRQAGHKMLALLLDPEKANPQAFSRAMLTLPDLILVGGSTGNDSRSLVRCLKQYTTSPIVLFPGRIEQFTEEADAVLFLSLLSGRNAEMLVGMQVQAARRIAESGIETIPMGYILIDGGNETTVQRVSHTHPIPQTDIRQIVDTCIAAQLMGKQLVYLEAGSGALHPVSTEVIRAVRRSISLPLIVGGGIRTPQALTEAYQAGADIVVIGNHLEAHPADIEAFAAARDNINQQRYIL